ncbi:uncharacterized protein PHALS_04483 [Plasmopara halstedii]|uniref:Uncharacterized protein n=1 Tax=Plasmopara halstedii TaxID=4781 RepID=A0A0P1A8I3_PLAHL|nr:uncharacterized protein PHALS_04483 [Plasmopara halstedii]CEG37018.1 hypothetical protein PHALS_04483 [Plasmopara halstedii]|eukprot:XP_024573387.1 hypothetical protein PHALS_04483 [Plasmopara halstedii]
MRGLGAPKKLQGRAAQALKQDAPTSSSLSCFVLRMIKIISPSSMTSGSEKMAGKTGIAVFTPCEVISGTYKDIIEIVPQFEYT